MKIIYRFFILFLFLNVLGRLCLGQTKPIALENNYIGSAEGSDLVKVRAAALENMIQKIQMFVQSEFKRYKEETATSFTD